METKQNYLTIGDNRIEVETPVSLIYEMDGEAYFASFRSALNEKGVYYQIESKNTDKVTNDKIVLYEIKSK